jgi:hypothetical protein
MRDADDLQGILAMKRKPKEVGSFTIGHVGMERNSEQSIPQHRKGVGNFGSTLPNSNKRDNYACA